jgi:hypothetical protein
MIVTFGIAKLSGGKSRLAGEAGVYGLLELILSSLVHYGVDLLENRVVRVATLVRGTVKGDTAPGSWVSTSLQ